MNIVKMSISNSREGILTINPPHLTCISDQKIENGDIILHPQYSKVISGDVHTFVVKDVTEERPSKGDWKDKEPSIFRRIEFEKHPISGKMIMELGHLKTEAFKDDKGVIQEKTFLIF